MLQVANDRDMRARMAAAGRNKAERLYTWQAERSRLLTHLGIEH
jgi:hypothetical protein